MKSASSSASVSDLGSFSFNERLGRLESCAGTWTRSSSADEKQSRYVRRLALVVSVSPMIANIEGQ